MFLFPLAGQCYTEEEVGVSCNKYCSDKIGKLVLVCNDIPVVCQFIYNNK